VIIDFFNHLYPASFIESFVKLRLPQQLRFLLDGETEVRCGAETDLGVQLERLRATLKAISKQSMAVRYIDVRFKEPVIAPRT